MKKKSIHLVEEHQSGLRLDLVLQKVLEQEDFSRSYIQKLIREGFITVNDRTVKAGYKTRQGDHLMITLPEPKKNHLYPENIALDIIHEEKTFIVLNKPAGMTVHPGAGVPSGTLVNALLYHCTGLSVIGGIERPGIVHRLDKTTSGVMVVAKTDRAHRRLSRAFQQHTVKKQYLAIIVGNIIPESGRIEYAITRHKSCRTKMAASLTEGREAVSEYRLRERFSRFDLVEVRPHHGRTHQIRVHLSHYGHPVLGDTTYGHGLVHALGDEQLKAKVASLNGNALHAWKITLPHPETGEQLTFEAPPPPAFNGLVAYLREAYS